MDVTHTGGSLTLRGYAIRQGSDGRWWTWSPDEPKGLPTFEDATCLAALQRVVAP